MISVAYVPFHCENMLTMELKKSIQDAHKRSSTKYEDKKMGYLVTCVSDSGNGVVESKVKNLFKTFIGNPNEGNI